MEARLKTPAAAVNEVAHRLPGGTHKAINANESFYTADPKAGTESFSTYYVGVQHDDGNRTAFFSFDSFDECVSWVIRTERIARELQIELGLPETQSWTVAEKIVKI